MDGTLLHCYGSMVRAPRLGEVSSVRIGLHRGRTLAPHDLYHKVFTSANMLWR
jgi:hypothetical protein